jgi:hypothetical protein
MDRGFLRIFGPKMEVDGLRRKLPNDELHSLYSLPNTVTLIKARKLRWTGYMAGVGDWRCVYTVLVWRPESKRPLGRTGRSWEDKIVFELSGDK